MDELVLQTPHLSPVCTRWSLGRPRYRPAGEVIDVSCYGVEPINESDAKAFVCKWHYSASYPAARARFGLLRALPHGGMELAGVIVFAVPMQNAAISKYLGVEPLAGVELSRLVLLDDVPANGESYFLGQAFKLLRKVLPGVQGVISYADPIRRLAADGTVKKESHRGIVYQAHNGRFLGLSGRRTQYLTRSGDIMSERAISKLRNDERGANYAYQQFLTHGAPKKKSSQTNREYVQEVLKSEIFQRFRHPGNFVYAWPLGSANVKKRLSKGMSKSLPYPRKEDLVNLIYC